MSIAYFCILIAAILPLIWTVVAKVNIGFDLQKNRNPREHLALSKGLAQRANWAQANSWEAFAPFAAAVIICIQVGLETSLINNLSIAFILIRIVYGVLYIIDWAMARSIAWFGAAAINYYLFYLGIVNAATIQ